MRVTAKMLPVLVLLSLFLQINGQISSKYYWREFEGTIPEDAVEGGTDRNGLNTYIGTSLFPEHNALLPSIIYQNDTFAHSYLGPFYLKSHINTKILCASKESQPRWKMVQFDRLKACICSFIKGGFQNNAILLIGRTKIDGRYVTGKVYPMENPYYGLEVWNEGNVPHILNFELLGYWDTAENPEIA